MQAEIVQGADGTPVLRLPPSLLNAGADVAALRDQVAALSRALGDAQVQASTKVRLGMDAAARDGFLKATAALTASQDRATAVSERIAAGLEALVAAVSAIKPTITTNVAAADVTFAPQIMPATVDQKLSLSVKAELPPRPERRATITAPDGTTYVVASEPR